MGGEWSSSGELDNIGAYGAGFHFLEPGDTAQSWLGEVSATSTEVQVTLANDYVLTGSGAHVDVQARRVSATEYYAARVELVEDGTVRLHAAVGDNTTLDGGVVSDLTHTPGEELRVRVQAEGTSPTTIRAKVWNAEDPEPEDWRALATDDTPALQVAGSIGLRSSLPSAATDELLWASADNLWAGPVGTAPPDNDPPHADFTWLATGTTVELDASESSDDHGINSYTWDYGDGAVGSGVTTSHTYSEPGIYTVVLTVMDSHGIRDQIGYEVEVDTPFLPDALAMDSFGRVLSGSWGDADEGGEWSSLGNVAGIHVSDDVGEHSLEPGHTVQSWLGEVSSTSTEVHVTLSTAAMPTGSGAHLDVLARRVSATEYYAARVELVEDGSVRLHAAVGDNTTLDGGVVSGLTYTPGDELRVRVQAEGTSPTTIRAKVWNAQDAEPEDWRAVGTDDASALQVAGAVGLRTNLPPDATGEPLIVHADNFWAGPTDVWPGHAEEATGGFLDVYEDPALGPDSTGQTGGVRVEGWHDEVQDAIEGTPVRVVVDGVQTLNAHVHAGQSDGESGEVFRLDTVAGPGTYEVCGSAYYAPIPQWPTYGLEWHPFECTSVVVAPAPVEVPEPSQAWLVDASDEVRDGLPVASSSWPTVAASGCANTDDWPGEETTLGLRLAVAGPDGHRVDSDDLPVQASQEGGMTCVEATWQVDQALWSEADYRVLAQMTGTDAKSSTWFDGEDFAAPQTPEALMLADLDSDVLTAEDFAYYGVDRWLNPQDVPVQYQVPTETAQGDLTAAMAWATQHFEDLDHAAQQDVLGKLSSVAKVEDLDDPALSDTDFEEAIAPWVDGYNGEEGPVAGEASRTGTGRATRGSSASVAASDPVPNLGDLTCDHDRPTVDMPDVAWCHYKTPLGVFAFVDSELDPTNGLDFGVDKVDSRLGDVVGGNGLPDHLDAVALAYHQAYRVYTDLGFARPPKLFVTLRAFNNGGIAVPAGNTIVIDKKATVYLIRHELFHHFQYATAPTSRYQIFSDYSGVMSPLLPSGGFTVGWWAEATAEWAAHQAEDSYGWGYGSEVFNDGKEVYSRKLEDHLGRPRQALTTAVPLASRVFDERSPEYGSFLFAEYLEEQFGTSVIRQTWNKLDAPFWAPVRAIDAIDSVLDELHGAQLSDVIANYHAANYTITNPTDYELGYTTDTDRDLWRSRLSDAGLEGRPGAWTMTPRWHVPASADWTTISPGGAFYLDVRGAVAGGDGQSMNLAIHVTNPDATLVQLRHISKRDGDTGIAQECSGWRWAEPFAPDADGNVNVDLTLFQACPDLAVIVSSTNPDPAQLPIVVDWTITTRAISTAAVVEDLGGHGISYRVEAGPDLDRLIGPGGESQVWMKIPRDLSTVGAAVKFCVYADGWLDSAALGLISVNGTPTRGAPFWGWRYAERADAAGRHRTPDGSGSGSRDCDSAPTDQLTAGYHSFSVALDPDEAPMRLDAVFLNYYRTDYCTEPEPWKDDYPWCDS